MTGWSIAAPVALAALVVAAGITDLRSRRIPNWLSLAGLLAGLALGLMTGGIAGAGRACLGMGLAFLIYFPLYLVRGMGAGDVKLMAAVGALAGPSNWLIIFFFTVVVAAVFTVVAVILRGRLGKTLRNTGWLIWELAHLRPPYLRHEELDVRSERAFRLPHGAFVTLGALLFLILRFGRPL